MPGGMLKLRFDWYIRLQGPSSKRCTFSSSLSNVRARCKRDTRTRQRARNRDLKHRRRGRQRERQKTIGLISKTLTPHVHYTLWYISLPSSAKQRREMTKFKVLSRT